MLPVNSNPSATGHGTTPWSLTMLTVWQKAMQQRSIKHEEIPVQRALKFSQVFGQTSLNSSMIIRPAVNKQQHINLVLASLQTQHDYYI